MRGGVGAGNSGGEGTRSEHEREVDGDDVSTTNRRGLAGWPPLTDEKCRTGGGEAGGVGGDGWAVV